MRILLHYKERQSNPEFPETFPNELLDEGWTDKIHSQTLKRLNERGGLSPMEIMMNVNKWTFQEGMKQWELHGKSELPFMKMVLDLLKQRNEK